MKQAFKDHSKIVSESYKRGFKMGLLVGLISLFTILIIK